MANHESRDLLERDIWEFGNQYFKLELSQLIDSGPVPVSLQARGPDETVEWNGDEYDLLLNAFEEIFPRMSFQVLNNKGELRQANNPDDWERGFSPTEENPFTWLVDTREFTLTVTLNEETSAQE